jgi:putative addiction module component (TIGR02574 family)
MVSYLAVTARVEDLWDDLAGTPEAVPVRDWQRPELSRRKANQLSHPAAEWSWDDAKQRARTRQSQ